LKFVIENKLNVHTYHASLSCDFPLIARSGTRHVTVTLTGCVRGNLEYKPWCWRMWKLLAFEYVETSVGKTTGFEKLNPMHHVLAASQ